MKIEVGKKYVTVDGSKVFIHCKKKNPNKFPFIGEFEDGILVGFTEDGKYTMGDPNHKCNITSECKEKLVINFEVDLSEHLKDLETEEIEEAIRSVIDNNYSYALSNGHSLTPTRLFNLLKNSDFKITLLDK